MLKKARVIATSEKEMQRKSDLPDTTEISTVIDHQWSVRRHPRIIRLPFRPSLRNHLSRAFLCCCCCCCLQFLLWSRLGSGRRHHHCDVKLSLSLSLSLDARCSLLHHPYSAIAKPNPSSLHVFGSLLLLAVVFFCAIAASLVWPLPPVARLPCKRLRVQIPLRTYTTLRVLSGSWFRKGTVLSFFFFFFIEPLVRVWKQFSRFIKSWVPQTVK